MKKLEIRSQILFFTLLLSFIFLASSELAFSGTGGEQIKPVYEEVEGLATGWGGKFVALMSFVAAGIAAARGSLMAFIPSLGVGIITAVGPTIVTSGVSAII